MANDIQAVIASAVARAPEWIRRELLADEKAMRARAEEALAAMIADALNRSEVVMQTQATPSSPVGAE
jgi:hypothetical protein